MKAVSGNTTEKCNSCDLLAVFATLLENTVCAYLYLIRDSICKLYISTVDGGVSLFWNIRAKIK